MGLGNWCHFPPAVVSVIKSSWTWYRWINYKCADRKWYRCSLLGKQKRSKLDDRSNVKPSYYSNTWVEVFIFSTFNLLASSHSLFWALLLKVFSVPCKGKVDYIKSFNFVTSICYIWCNFTQWSSGRSAIKAKYSILFECISCILLDFTLRLFVRVLISGLLKSFI